MTDKTTLAARELQQENERLRHQLAQPPRCWCGKELEPASGQPGMWNACENCTKLAAQDAAEAMEDENRLLRAALAPFAAMGKEIKASRPDIEFCVNGARDSKLSGWELWLRAAGATGDRPAQEYEHLGGAYELLCHDMKALRQAMDCDGSDLPQLLAAWDKLAAARRKADLEVERLRGRLAKATKTADGVPVHEGMELWWWDEHGSLCCTLGTTGIFEAVTMWNDGHRMLARLVFALSAGAYIGIAPWYYRGKPSYRERR